MQRIYILRYRGGVRGIRAELQVIDSQHDKERAVNQNGWKVDKVSQPHSL